MTYQTQTAPVAAQPETCDAPIERRIMAHAEAEQFQSLVIDDSRVTPAVIDAIFLAIDGPEVVELGKKRCTKWRNGRRFCAQREGVLKWRFGWEYQ